MGESTGVTVSVIMPAYNAEETINESINSVLAQTYKSWELIIIDDYSKTAVEFEHEKVMVVRNDSNRGVAYSRNRGISLARGEYIAFLDADDIWRDDKLELQLAFMLAHKALISYTASAFFNSGYVMSAVEKLHYKELLRRNIMSCSSVVIMRELLLKYPFPLRTCIHEDYVVWMRILREYGVAYGLNEPMLTYRLSKGSKTARRLKSAMMTSNAYREVGYSGVVSAVMTVRYAVWSIYKRYFIANG